MQLRCPHCQAKLGLFSTRNAQARIKDGACPLCKGCVALGANARRSAIVLPFAAVAAWLSWGYLPPALVGLAAALLIWLTVMQLNPAP